MTYRELVTEYAWHVAECQTIAGYAQTQGYNVTADTVSPHVETWRRWYHGLLCDRDLTISTGVTRTAVRS